MYLCSTNFLKGMENKENRFNKKSAVWYEILWLIIALLIAWGGISLLAGCGSNKRMVKEDSRVELDSSVEKKQTIKQDSTRHDSIVVVKAADKFFGFHTDSTSLSQVIERNTIIRQDADGKEISRESSTIINNNRERTRNNNLSQFHLSEESNTVRDIVLKNKLDSLERLQKQLQKNSLYEHPQVEEKTEWYWIKKVFWLLLKILGKGLFYAFCIFFLGKLFYEGYSLFRKLFNRAKLNRNGGEDDGEKKKV